LVVVKEELAISWKHLMDPLAAMMKTLGNPELTNELKQTITQEVLHQAGNRSVEQLAQKEREILLNLLRIRTGQGQMESTSK
jgi:hypothetical protein